MDMEDLGKMDLDSLPVGTRVVDLDGDRYIKTDRPDTPWKMTYRANGDVIVGPVGSGFVSSYGPTRLDDADPARTTGPTVGKDDIQVGDLVTLRVTDLGPLTDNGWFDGDFVSATRPPTPPKPPLPTEPGSMIRRKKAYNKAKAVLIGSEWRMVNSGLPANPDQWQDGWEPA